MNSLKRRLSVATTIALVAGVLALSASISPASAGTQVNINACDNGATFTYAEVPVTFSGTASPNPATLGVDTVTLALADYGVEFDPTLLLAGYNLGLLVPGLNTIPAVADITINASNTVEGSFTHSGVAFTAFTTITDNAPAGPGPEDSATPLAVSVSLPDTTWTPNQGGVDIVFTDGGSNINAVLGGGLITVAFGCEGASSARMSR